MSKEELLTKIEGKEEQKELLTLEEKIEIIQKIFEYCENNYGLKNYTVDLVNENNQSSYAPNIYKHTANEIMKIINPVERFKISLNIREYKNFYAHNNLITKLELSEKDKQITKFIYTCLHEIGHSICDSIIFKNKPTNEDLKNFVKYDRTMYKKIKLFEFVDIDDDVRKAVYKYNHNETVADCFAYSVLPQVLKDFNIQTDYFNITKSKGKNKFNDKLRIEIKRIILGTNSPIIIKKVKIDLNKDNIINKFTKQYLDNILVSDEDYYTACKVLEYLTRYGYSVLIKKYIDNETYASSIKNYLKYFNNLDDMISPKYKKFIEKDWYEIGARNIAFIEFPRVWRELQEKGVI